jgi:predicted double-glycine peptidase
VYIGDPVLGHKRYKIDDFLKGWNGIIFAVIGQGYDKNNVLLDPPLPLTPGPGEQLHPGEGRRADGLRLHQSDFF